MKVIAIDFDGVLCRDAWPEIGKEIPFMVRRVKELQKKGYRIILWTCRSGEKLQEAVEWCQARGLIFDAVNENLPELIQKYGTDPRKVGADIYIDDKNMTLTEFGGFYHECHNG